MSGHIEGFEFRRGKEGDARRGTVYGHRSAKEYNKVKIAQTEKEEGRKVVLLHYAKVSNDRRIERFYVVNGHLDPDMKVVSRAEKYISRPLTATGDPSKGTLQVMELTVYFEEWPRFEMDGQYCFFAPASYTEGPISWFHNKDLGDESLVYESDKVFWIPNPQNQKGVRDVGLTEVTAEEMAQREIEAVREGMIVKKREPGILQPAKPRTGGLILPPGADFDADDDAKRKAGTEPGGENDNTAIARPGSSPTGETNTGGDAVRGSADETVRSSEKVNTERTVTS